MPARVRLLRGCFYALQVEYCHAATLPLRVQWPLNRRATAEAQSTAYAVLNLCSAVLGLFSEGRCIEGRWVAIGSELHCFMKHQW